MRRKLGNTGVEVNAIGLGEWQLSNTDRPSWENAIDLIRQAVEAGVDFIDTADSYALDDKEFGHGERLVKAALDSFDSAHVTVTTKVGATRPGGEWGRNGQPDWIRKACEDSLERLGTESIFLYQLHGIDEEVALEDTVGALDELKTQGKVQHLGLSNVDTQQLARAQNITRIETVQNACNPWRQDDVTSGLIRECELTNVAYLPFYPVGGKDQHQGLSSQSLLKPIAENYRTSTYCVLLNWLLRMGSNVIPIPGASRVNSILDSVKAVEFKLSDEEVEQISTLS